MRVTATPSFDRVYKKLSSPNLVLSYNGQNNIRLDRRSIAHDGDCALRSLGVESREHAVKLLLSAINLPYYRNLISPEIVGAFREKTLRPILKESGFSDLFNLLEAKQKELDEKPNREKQNQLDERLLNFCKGYELQKWFIQRFVGQRNAWLTIIPDATTSLDALAEIMRTHLVITQRDEKANQIKIIHDFKPRINKTENVKMLFHTNYHDEKANAINEGVHFELLFPIKEDREKGRKAFDLAVPDFSWYSQDELHDKINSALAVVKKTSDFDAIFRYLDVYILYFGLPKDYSRLDQIFTEHMRRLQNTNPDLYHDNIYKLAGKIKGTLTPEIRKPLDEKYSGVLFKPMDHKPYSVEKYFDTFDDMTDDEKVHNAELLIAEDPEALNNAHFKALLDEFLEEVSQTSNRRLVVPDLRKTPEKKLTP